MMIDIHAHLFPKGTIDEIGKRATDFPNVEFKEESGRSVRFKIGQEPWTRPVPPILQQVSSRKENLQQNNIDLQLNAGWLDVYGYSLPPEEGLEWSRLLNDSLRHEIGDEPLFETIATVPLQDGALAAEELQRAAATGHKGVMIGSYIPEGIETPAKELDDVSLDPFWATASEQGMPVFLHPVFAGANPRAGDFGLVNTVARPSETALCLSRVLYAGIPQRFPRLKLIVSHGGGSLPYILGRLERNFKVLQESDVQIFDPVEGFKNLYFDSVVFEPKSLDFLLSFTGTDKIMMGSDAPFPIGDPDQAEVIRQARLSSEEMDGLFSKNAESVFNIE